MKKLIFILPLLYYSCTDDIIADIDALQTENTEQDAQMDSLLTIITTQQEYIDSMNNVQNTYIDSLHNAQQTTLTALANSALTAGFTPVQIYNSEAAIPNTTGNAVTTELDLTGTIGSQQSIVLLKIETSNTTISMSYDITDENHNLTNASGSYSLYASENYTMLSTTDGIVYLVINCQYGGPGECSGITLTATVVFFMN